MKMVVAYIRHEGFEPIRHELLELGFPSLSVSEVKGFGYVFIEKQKWCIVSAEAELMEATTGRPMGETYFGSRDGDTCQVLWKAAQANYRVDISAIPEKSVTDPLFIGSVKKIYVVGYVWVRLR